MTVDSVPRLDPSIRAALDDLQGIIRRRYPEARFAVVRGEDPEGTYLKAIIDVADVDEVVDQELLDCLFEVQVERGLAVYVIPLQPVDRVLAELSKRPQPPML